MQAIAANPFSPQFGRKPELYVGRETLMQSFIQALDEPNSPVRTTIVSGIRGSGKTSFLSSIKESLRDRAVVIDTAATDNLGKNIVDQLYRAAKQRKVSLSGINLTAMGFGAGVQTSVNDMPHGLLYYLTEFVTLINKKNPVVFLVDEVHNDTAETREFVSSYQLLVRDNADVALLMAGLPKGVNSVLNDKILTFLHRCNKLVLEGVDIMLVEDLYRRAFNKSKLDISSGIAKKAADASCGFPYLIQLVGFYLFNKLSNGFSEAEALANALLNAKAELFHNVYDVMLRETSARDTEFLLGMKDESRSFRFSNIVTRLGYDKNHYSGYRRRLLESGYLKEMSKGLVALAPPYLQEYLQSLSEY